MNTRSTLYFFAALFWFFSAQVWAQTDETWELRKEKENIKVFTRSNVSFGLHAFRGEAIIPSSAGQIVSTLKDASNWHQWVPDCASSKMLAAKDSNIQMHYTVTDLPFPLADRDLILHLDFLQTTAGYHIKLSGLPEHLPPVDGLVRVPHLKGDWIIVALSENESHVTYQVHTDPGGSVPTWLANSTAVSTPFNTLKNLREYLQ